MSGWQLRVVTSPRLVPLWVLRTEPAAGPRRLHLATVVEFNQNLWSRKPGSGLEAPEIWGQRPREPGSIHDCGSVSACPELTSIHTKATHLPNPESYEPSPRLCSTFHGDP